MSKSAYKPVRIYRLCVCVCVRARAPGVPVLVKSGHGLIFKVYKRCAWVGIRERIIVVLHGDHHRPSVLVTRYALTRRRARARTHTYTHTHTHTHARARQECRKLERQVTLTTTILYGGSWVWNFLMRSLWRWEFWGGINFLENSWNLDIRVCMYFFINFISQHVPLQKAILHARDCLYVTCVICFYIYSFI